jgi:hypothetical protein
MHIARRTLVPALVFLALAGCGEEPPALRVGELAFSAEQLAGLTAEDREALADLAAVGSAMSARQTDSLVAPLVRREGERARLQALPEHLGAQRMGITGEALRTAYAARPEWELRVRHVVRLVPRWASDEDRAEARRVAAEAERRARAGEDFAALAAEFSEEPGAAERGGLLEPGREGSWVDPFWSAALALQPGETSPVVETEYGYHVLRLEERRALPFEEAARLPILRRLVPRARALAAMEEWVATRPPVSLDPPAVLAAREALRGGSAPDSLVLATGPSGQSFTAWDLAVAWAALQPEQRAGLRRADDAGFASWVEGEAREAFWAEAAREMGVERPAGTLASARTRWEQQVARWASTLGIREGMPPEQVAAAALRGVAATGQEARIVREELQAARPVIRKYQGSSTK